MLSKFKLKNGLTVLCLPMDSTKAVTIMLMVGAGSRYETKKINGISHFLEHLFFKGSKKYPSTQQIANIIDGIGGIDNAGTEKEWTNYWIKCSSEKIDIALDVLSSMVKESLLSSEEIEKEKGVIVEELNMYRDDPKTYVAVLAEELMFGDTPLGWDIGGSNETIKTFARDDFIKYMDSLYSPKNMVFVVTGNVTEKKAKELAEKYLSDLPQRGMFTPEKKVQKNSKPSVQVQYKKTDQAALVLGYYGPSLQNEDKYSARVLSAILGGGMSSRLFIEVREQRGLAYYIDAGASSYTDNGYIGIHAGLNLEKLELGVKVILEELEKIKNMPVDASELQKAKDMIKGRMVLYYEDSRAFAENIARQQILLGKVELLDEMNKKIDGVTIEQVQALAQKVFTPKNANLAVIAPIKNAKKLEKLLS